VAPEIYLTSFTKVKSKSLIHMVVSLSRKRSGKCKNKKALVIS